MARTTRGNNKRGKATEHEATQFPSKSESTPKTNANTKVPLAMRKFGLLRRSKEKRPSADVEEENVKVKDNQETNGDSEEKETVRESSRGGNRAQSESKSKRSSVGQTERQMETDETDSGEDSPTGSARERSRMESTRQSRRKSSVKSMKDDDDRETDSESDESPRQPRGESRSSGSRRSRESTSQRYKKNQRGHQESDTDSDEKLQRDSHRTRRPQSGHQSITRMYSMDDEREIFDSESEGKSGGSGNRRTKSQSKRGTYTTEGNESQASKTDFQEELLHEPGSKRRGVSFRDDESIESRQSTATGNLFSTPTPPFPPWLCFPLPPPFPMPPFTTQSLARDSRNNMSPFPQTLGHPGYGNTSMYGAKGVQPWWQLPCLNAEEPLCESITCPWCDCRIHRCPPYCCESNSTPALYRECGCCRQGRLPIQHSGAILNCSRVNPPCLSPGGGMSCCPKTRVMNCSCKCKQTALEPKEDTKIECRSLKCPRCNCCPSNDTDNVVVNINPRKKKCKRSESIPTLELTIVTHKKRRRKPACDDVCSSRDISFLPPTSRCDETDACLQGHIYTAVESERLKGVCGEYTAPKCSYLSKPFKSLTCADVTFSRDQGQNRKCYTCEDVLDQRASREKSSWQTTDERNAAKIAPDCSYATHRNTTTDVAICCPDKLDNSLREFSKPLVDDMGNWQGKSRSTLLPLKQSCSDTQKPFWCSKRSREAVTTDRKHDDLGSLSHADYSRIPEAKSDIWQHETSGMNLNNKHFVPYAAASADTVVKTVSKTDMKETNDDDCLDHSQYPSVMSQDDAPIQKMYGNDNETDIKKSLPQRAKKVAHDKCLGPEQITELITTTDRPHQCLTHNLNRLEDKAQCKTKLMVRSIETVGDDKPERLVQSQHQKSYSTFTPNDEHTHEEDRCFDLDRALLKSIYGDCKEAKHTYSPRLSNLLTALTFVRPYQSSVETPEVDISGNIQALSCTPQNHLASGTKLWPKRKDSKDNSRNFCLMACNESDNRMHSDIDVHRNYNQMKEKTEDTYSSSNQHESCKSIDENFTKYGDWSEDESSWYYQSPVGIDGHLVDSYDTEDNSQDPYFEDICVCMSTCDVNECEKTRVNDEKVENGNKVQSVNDCNSVSHKSSSNNTVIEDGSKRDTCSRRSSQYEVCGAAKATLDQHVPCARTCDPSKCQSSSSLSMPSSKGTASESNHMSSDKSISDVPVGDIACQQRETGNCVKNNCVCPCAKQPSPEQSSSSTKDCCGEMSLGRKGSQTVRNQTRDSKSREQSNISSTYLKGRKADIIGSQQNSRPIYKGYERDTKKKCERSHESRQHNTRYYSSICRQQSCTDQHCTDRLPIEFSDEKKCLEVYQHYSKNIGHCGQGMETTNEGYLQKSNKVGPLQGDCETKQNTYCNSVPSQCSRTDNYIGRQSKACHPCIRHAEDSVCKEQTDIWHNRGPCQIEGSLLGEDFACSNVNERCKNSKECCSSVCSDEEIGVDENDGKVREWIFCREWSSETKAYCCVPNCSTVRCDEDRDNNVASTCVGEVYCCVSQVECDNEDGAISCALEESNMRCYGNSDKCKKKADQFVHERMEKESNKKARVESSIKCNTFVCIDRNKHKELPCVEKQRDNDICCCVSKTDKDECNRTICLRRKCQTPKVDHKGQSHIIAPCEYTEWDSGSSTCQSKQTSQYKSVKNSKSIENQVRSNDAISQSLVSFDSVRESEQTTGGRLGHRNTQKDHGSLRVCPTDSFCSDIQRVRNGMFFHDFKWRRQLFLDFEACCFRRSVRSLITERCLLYDTEPCLLYENTKNRSMPLYGECCRCCLTQPKSDAFRSDTQMSERSFHARNCYHFANDCDNSNPHENSFSFRDRQLLAGISTGHRERSGKIRNHSLSDGVECLENKRSFVICESSSESTMDDSCQALSFNTAALHRARVPSQRAVSVTAKGQSLFAAINQRQARIRLKFLASTRKLSKAKMFEFVKSRMVSLRSVSRDSFAAGTVNCN